MLNRQEIIRNLAAVENAVAQQRLEGLEVPQETIEDLRRVAHGEINIEEGIKNAYRRFANAQVLKPRPLS